MLRRNLLTLFQGANKSFRTKQVRLRNFNNPNVRNFSNANLMTNPYAPVKITQTAFPEHLYYPCAALRNLSFNVTQIKKSQIKKTAFFQTESPKVQLLVSNASGITMDPFMIAPLHALVSVFKEFGVDISMAEARGTLTLQKDLHIKALTEMSSVREKWKKVHGKYPDQSDCALLYKLYNPLQDNCLANYCDALPGTADAFEKLRQMKIKIGFSTDFSQSQVTIIRDRLLHQNIRFDCMISSEEVSSPKPLPFMIFANMNKLQIANPNLVLTVGATTADIGEGINAGAWTVGVSRFTQDMNIDSLQQLKKMSQSELTDRQLISAQRLRMSGAHYVIPDLTFLPPVIRDINYRMAALNEFPVAMPFESLQKQAEHVLSKNEETNLKI